MIAHFNYTGRKRIDQKLIKIEVTNSAPRKFEASWDLREKPFPSTSKVYIEATSSGSTVVMRFPFGDIGNVVVPDTSLTEVTGDSISFTFKVVDETENVGRLLGMAENIRPKISGEIEGGGTQPILPVNAEDLGARVWRLNFKKERPWLEVNKYIPGIKSIAKNDPQFYALVFPEIIREILLRVVVHERHSDVTGDDGDWRDQWLRYGIAWHPEHAGPPANDDSQMDDSLLAEIEEWADTVVDSFCERKGVRHMFEESSNEENKL